MTIATPTRSSFEVFAAAVRRALDDLPPDDIEELTGGLEADLAEQAADAAGSASGSADGDDFGDAEAYAAELRAAAGLPPRSASPRRHGSFARVSAHRVGTAWNVALDRTRSTRGGAASLDFAVALRPVWWILRAWAVYQMAVAVFGSSYRGFELLPATPMRWAVLLPLLVLSIQWGRGRWMPGRWLRWTKTAVSVVAIAALLALLPSAIVNAGSSSTLDESQSDNWFPQGLTRDGVQVSNIFAYGADGEPLEQVRLFDQDGRPLDLVGSADVGVPWLSVIDENGFERLVLPSSAAPGQAGWNVYPLREADGADLDYSSDSIGELDSRDIEDARAPFRVVQPLAGRTGPSNGTSAVTPSPVTPSPAASAVTPTPAVP